MINASLVNKKIISVKRSEIFSFIRIRSPYVLRVFIRAYITRIFYTILANSKLFIIEPLKISKDFVVHSNGINVPYL